MTEQVKYVRCIDAGDVAQGNLTYGRVYVLEDKYMGMNDFVCRISEDDKGETSVWYAWRFEDVVLEIKEDPPFKNSTKSIAEKLVDRLFLVGDEAGKKTGRIQFMVGEYGVDEESSGGMNREALQRFVERELSILLKENT